MNIVSDIQGVAKVRITTKIMEKSNNVFQSVPLLRLMQTHLVNIWQ